MQTENNIQDSLFFTCEWFPSEQRLLLPPEDLSTSEHAEKNRYVVKSSRPGPWRNENNPPLIGIMNASDRRGNFRNMRLEVVIKGVQTGVTEGAYNVLFKRMDGSTSNALLAMENERKVRRVSKQRIQESIRRHGRLAEQMSDNPDDTTNYSITMRTGFNLNIGWAGSQAAMASDPCETVILDEVDKYDTPLNIEEAKDRTTTYRETGLAFILSTPGLEGGPITVEFDNCDAHLDYHVECPDCGHLQVMDFEHFWWPEKGEKKKPGEWKKLANAVAREKLARYACGSCGSLWDDYARDKAVRLGLTHNFYGWKMREEIAFPVSCGFKFPSWVSPFKSLSDIASRWLRAQEPGQAGKLQAWHNNEAAEPFFETIDGETVQHESLYARREDYGPDVPLSVAVLTLSADVQPDRIEAELVGWGMDEESWGIEHRIFMGDVCRPEVWKAFEEYRVKGFRHASGITLKVGITVIDTSDGNTSKWVCDYIRPRQSQRVYGIKGSNKLAGPIIDRRPSFKNKGKIALFFVGTDTAKSTIYANLQLESAGPGYMHYHYGYDDEYFKQLTAETVITKLHKGYAKREWIKTRPRNEALDIRAYALAALELLKTFNGFNLNRLAAEMEAKGKVAQEGGETDAETQKAKAGRRRKRGGWVKGWK